MKQIPVDALKPGVVFDQTVYIDGKDILVGAFQPLKKSVYERLKVWNLKYVYTDGKIVNEEDTEKELKNIVEDLVGKKAPDISELYYISSSNTADMQSAKTHQEMVVVVKKNFLKVKKGSFPDAIELRNAALSLISFVTKNKRQIFKLILISPKEPSEFLYYTAVNTALLGIAAGLTMKYSRLHLINLTMGSFLHDLGMTKISESILYKKEKLTETELNLLKKHPFYGYQLVRRSNAFSDDVALIVLQHHERLDGSGYPYGFKGKQISEYARLTAICDTYQAMCQEREYREAKSPPRIIKTLLEEGIGKLDNNMLKIFAYTVGVYPVGTWVKINDDSIGEVMIQNIKALTKPVVKLFLDKKGHVLSPPKILNLYKEKEFQVIRVLDNEEKKQTLRRLGRM